MSSRLHAGAARLRRAALWLIFGLILLVPKLNRLRRRRKLWNSIRILVALAGAAMLALGAARGHSPVLIAVGTLMVLFALLIAGKRPQFSIDARARELGALIVVDGGSYTDASGRRNRAKLFLAPDRLCVLDDTLRVLVEIPLQEIRALSVEPADGDWRFRIDSDESRAEFIYQHSFAEHLARVAEVTVRSRLHRELPVVR